MDLLLLENLYLIGILVLLTLLLIFIGRYTSERVINALEVFFNHPPLPVPASTEMQDNQNDRVYTLGEFVRYNAPLFTVIGITGTMLSLIPTFLEKIIGIDWKLEILSDFTGLCLLVLIQILLISLGLLILFMATLILYSLFTCNFSQVVIHSIFNHNITIGTLYRLFFSLIFIPSVFGFVYFIMAIFLVQKDPYFLLINQIVFAFYFVIICFILIILVTLLLPNNRPNSYQIKTGLSLLIFIVLIVGLIALFMVTIPAITKDFLPSYHPENRVEIISDFKNYSISDSPSMGMRLEVGGNGTLSTIDRSNYLRFHWSTTYGNFISYDPISGITKIQGNYFSSSQPYPVFWTYDIKDQGIKKPPVTIYLTVENIRKKENVGSDYLVIGWADVDTAHALPWKVS